jgi:hypothetical protein
MCLLKEISIWVWKLRFVLTLGIEPSSFDQKFTAFTSKVIPFWNHCRGTRNCVVRMTNICVNTTTNWSWIWWPLGLLQAIAGPICAGERVAASLFQSNYSVFTEVLAVFRLAKIDIMEKMSPRDLIVIFSWIIYRNQCSCNGCEYK